MPGVPSGRGCDACRRQKKKCDQASPQCSRCSRLHLACVGSGQRRYKFQTVHHVQANSVTGPWKAKGKTALGTNKDKDDVDVHLVCFPSNKIALLRKALIYVTQLKTDIRYNVAWNYGGFIWDLPQRLGHNDALDATVELLLSGHTDLSQHRSAISTYTLEAYVRSLGALRRCLDDESHRHTPETLCAVTLLVLCQSFVYTNKSRWTSHCQGATRIMKARGYSFDPKNDFESKLVLSLRGPVLFEGFLSDKIQLSPKEWELLVTNDLDSHQVNEGRTLHCLARVPGFIHRGRKVVQQGCVDANLRGEIKSEYEVAQTIITNIRRLVQQPAETARGGEPAYYALIPFRALRQRAYGFSLLVAMILNSMLRALDVHDEHLNADADHFVSEILHLAADFHQYRPMGAASIPLLLGVAHVVATTSDSKNEIITVLDDYQDDFPWSTSDIISRNLEWLSRRLTFRDVLADDSWN